MCFKVVGRYECSHARPHPIEWDFYKPGDGRSNVTAITDASDQVGWRWFHVLVAAAETAGAGQAGAPVPRWTWLGRTFGGRRGHPFPALR
jgi:hypothetical protein